MRARTIDRDKEEKETSYTKPKEKFRAQACARAGTHGEMQAGRHERRHEHRHLNAARTHAQRRTHAERSEQVRVRSQTPLRQTARAQGLRILPKVEDRQAAWNNVLTFFIGEYLVCFFVFRFYGEIGARHISCHRHVHRELLLHNMMWGPVAAMLQRNRVNPQICTYRNIQKRYTHK